jgi:hypothetical protein
METLTRQTTLNKLVAVPQFKVRTNLRGGVTTQPTGGYVNGVYYPDKSGVCGTSTVPPTTGGGYVNGVYYPDQSGVCGGTTPPPTTGGGYIGGVYYSDKSGVCG